jgi:DNA-binding response OmpR family regulator
LLSIKEADLLKILFDNIGELVKRDTILTYVWGKVDDYAANSMDVYLSRLRKLLKEDSQIMIENLHGTGYKLHIHNAK